MGERESGRWGELTSEKGRERESGRMMGKECKGEGESGRERGDSWRERASERGERVGESGSVRERKGVR